MGEVELVHDEVRDEDVALKRVLRASPDGLLRLKREFRVVEALRHPNLVRLYELDEDARGAFFTMEHVDGRPLLTFLRGEIVATEPEATHTTTIGSLDRAAPTRTAPVRETVEGARSSRTAPRRLEGIRDPTRIRSVMAQLGSALAFLHHHGIAHRDLKPSNVLVRANGAVTLLDFGVLADVNRDRRGEAIGTVPYMAPEQLRGLPPTAAIDAYAFGVLLYEAYAGRRPFEGDDTAVIAQHIGSAPPRLEAAAPWAPIEIAHLCDALLRKRPEERPTLDAVARLLAHGDVSASWTGNELRLRGREVAQAALRERLDALKRPTFAAVTLIGATGVGKTALSDWLCAQARDEGACVLSGRGRPTDRIAFNAVDGAIDDLAREIVRRPLREDARVALVKAATLFPVLARDSEAVAASRTEAFDATIAILEAVAAPRRVVVAVDDLHFADPDAIALLDALAAAQPMGVLVLATARDDVGETPGLAWARSKTTAIAIMPLPEDAVREILVDRTAGVRAIDDEATISAAIDTCHGRPFLATVVALALARGRRIPGSLAEWTTGTLASLSPAVRSVLVGVVVTAEWVSVGDLAGALDMRIAAVEDAIAALVEDGLIRTAGARGPDARVDVLHDALRNPLQESLDPADQRMAHEHLAAWFARAASPAPHRIVRHLLGAGKPGEAARLALKAARIAENKLAYGLAAEMYGVALRERPTDVPMLRARGASLARVGRYADSAQCWRAVAAHAPSAEDLQEATMREAEALFACDAIVDGYAALNRALVAAGQPKLGSTGFRVLVSVLLFLLGPIARPRARSGSAPAATRARAERDVRASGVVAFFDPLGGVNLVQRLRRECIAQGAPGEAAWSEYFLAYMAMLASPRLGPVRLACRYRSCADARLGNRENARPEARAAAAIVDVVERMRGGDWAPAEAIAEKAIAELEGEGLRGTHALLLLRMVRTEIEVYREDLLALGHQLRRVQREFEEIGEGGSRFQFELLEVNRLALGGRHEEAFDLLSRLDQRWPSSFRTFQRTMIDGISVYRFALTGQGIEGRRANERFLRNAGSYHPFRVMYAGTHASYSALLEVQALRAGDSEASPRKARYFARVALAAPPFSTALAVRSLAYLAEHEGNAERARTGFEDAVRHAKRFGQRRQLAISQYQLGRYIGGDEGAVLMRDARGAARAGAIEEHVLDEHLLFK